MVRPLVWFVLRVKPILLVTLQVKIHTHQPDLIQGSDSTVEIQDQGNPLEAVLVEGSICTISYTNLSDYLLIRYPNYEVSPDESPPMQRRTAYQNGDRDYSRPLPPTYRRQGRSRVADPSPSRHSYHDSAYSSHSSHSSDNPAFSVIPPTTTMPRPPLSTQSSPSKSYSRQNSFSYDSNQKINSRTFRKQKSPMRNRSPSLSPSRLVI
jgi:hypothetical protein